MTNYYLLVGLGRDECVQKLGVNYYYNYYNY